YLIVYIHFDLLAWSVFYYLMDLFLFLFFFFSSRRRHTRSKRDWSSDVCSSDLAKIDPKAIIGVKSQYSDQFWLQFAPAPKTGGRSEERRVGKECRSRWSA